MVLELHAACTQEHIEQLFLIHSLERELPILQSQLHESIEDVPVFDFDFVLIVERKQEPELNVIGLIELRELLGDSEHSLD